MNMIKCVLQRNMIQIKHNKLRIPTGGRLTSWLITRRGGVEFGATEDKSNHWQGEGFEPGTSGLQIQRPTTRPRSLPARLPERRNSRHFSAQTGSSAHSQNSRMLNSFSTLKCLFYCMGLSVGWCVVRSMFLIYSSFGKKLPYKRGKPYAIMPKVITGNSSLTVA